MTLLLQLLGGALALALGLYLGMPGVRGRTGARGRRWRGGRAASRRPAARFEGHDEEELEQLERDLGMTRGLPRKAKRHFTPLDLLRSKQRASKERRARSHFRTVAPSAEAKREG